MITLEKLSSGLKLESVNEIVASSGGASGVSSFSLTKQKSKKEKKKKQPAKQHAKVFSLVWKIFNRITLEDWSRDNSIFFYNCF